MSKWRFWSRQQQEPTATPPQAEGIAVASRARGFSAPPPRSFRKLAADFDTSDPAMARKVERLERLEQQLEEAEVAARRDNPWNDRAQLIDQAIAALGDQIQQPIEQVNRPHPSLPDWPLTIDELEPESPSRVVIAADQYRFPFAEEIDWAERGTTVVKGDLLLEGDDLSRLARVLGLDLHATERLFDALFALATDARDAALAGRPRARIDRFDHLLGACPICGDIQLWNGVCLSCVDRRARLARLEAERQRLFVDRDAVLAERAAKVEQLPVLRKRYAEAIDVLRQQR